jgi:UDP-N-acetylmuramoylalanine--D-glutamate ligase
MSDALLAPRLKSSGWNGRRVTLLGLGRHGGGVGAARYLASQGARLTISDAAPAETLATSLAALQDLPLEAVHCGGHRLDDVIQAEVVVVNPAVREDHPALVAARAAGAAITSEIELLLERCPARVIGVSGSNGKTTTATMLAEILKAAHKTTWLGGNVGGSLLGELDQMSRDDWGVLELSSFQLAHLGPAARLPNIAVLTNCTPNHLDWHSSWEDYVAAKRRLLGCEQVVLNVHDAELSRWDNASGQAMNTPWPLERLPRLRVSGEHNRQNAACAAAAAELAGVDEATIVSALGEFRGLEHRIEPVGSVQGRTFYNDSKSTSPAATLAAMQAVDAPLWLLAGGVSKQTDFTEVAEQVAKCARGAALFGHAAEEIARAIRRQAACDVSVHAELGQALTWCFERSEAGDVILLSPACASFDQFADYAHRGRVFRELVAQLADRANWQ